MFILPKAIYRFNTIPIKIPIEYITEIEKATLKFVWNHKSHQIARALQRKRTKPEASHFLISNNTMCEAIVIKTVWYWYKNICDYIKLKISAQQKKQQNEKAPMGEDFCKSYLDKGLTSKIYKETIQLNNKKANNLIKKWAEELNRHFSKEDMQIANEYMKRVSTSQIMREMQIKTAVRYHFTLVRMAIIKKSRNNK